MQTFLPIIQKNPSVMFRHTHIVKQLGTMIGDNLFNRLQFNNDSFVIEVGIVGLFQ